MQKQLMPVHAIMEMSPTMFQPRPIAASADPLNRIPSHLKRWTASVPQIPPAPWTGMASSGSSIYDKKKKACLSTYVYSSGQFSKSPPQFSKSPPQFSKRSARGPCQNLIFSATNAYTYKHDITLYYLDNTPFNTLAQWWILKTPLITRTLPSTILTIHPPILRQNGKF